MSAKNVADFIASLSVEYEEVTPRTAKEILNSGNRRNRKLNEARVRYFEGVIKRGEWMPDSTDAIGIDSNGNLVNAQHRLEAIARGEVAVYALVARGVRPEVIQVIDQVTPRTMAQTLDIDGNWTDTAGVQAAVVWLYAMINHWERAVPGDSKATVPQLLAILGDHPNIVKSLENGALASSRFKVNGMSKGVFTAYHYAMASVDPDQADEFYIQVANGIDLEEGSPAYALREVFIRDMTQPPGRSMKRWQACAKLVTAWEAHRNGEQLSEDDLSVIASVDVPSVSGVDWLSESDSDN